MNRSLTAVLLGTTALVWTNASAFSQDAQPASPLPDVVVEQPSAKPKVAAKAKPKNSKSAPAQTQSAPANTVASPPSGDSYEPVTAAGLGASGATSGPVAPGTRSGSLTVPTISEAKADLETTPGGVDLVPSDEYAKSTPAVTLKDALDYVPGVFVQPKWGEDSRLSIRGSGLSRNFHGRGVTLLMDGVIPISTADGGSDFQEIDPSAYRFIEVYKGGNALRFGANSLGGAINFVIPTGYDADLFGARLDVGSFGFHKLAVSSGAVSGSADYFITGSWQEQDGFRDHSSGESTRASANIGYRLSENIETRFYVNANHIRQKIPGALQRSEALADPKMANPTNITLDYERNLDTLRVANKTAVRIAPGTLVELGGFYMDRHLDHPIFQVLDNQHDEYGGFARVVTETEIAGYRNRLTAGINIHNGEIHARNYTSVFGDRGALVNDQIQDSRNTVLYAENAFYATSALALIAGVQWSDIERRLDDRLISVVNGNLVDESRQGDFTSWNPKGGFTYDFAPGIQLFGNVSKSSEAPTFGEIRFPGQIVSGQDLGTLDQQEAVTYEIGTRGALPGIIWDLALYRSNLDGEFQCQVARNMAGEIIPGSCNQINLDKTIHQGVEVGVALRLFDGVFAKHNGGDEVWLNSAYTFSDFRFDGDAEFGDNELPGAPRHFLRAELLYKHPSGIYFGPNVEWVPEAFYVDSANTLETEEYALLGAKLGFDDGGPISAYIEGRNLTDEAYIASASIATRAVATDRIFEPGNGRAVYGGVRVKW
jgi:iron complex outermembrane receptor protein